MLLVMHIIMTFSDDVIRGDHTADTGRLLHYPPQTTRVLCTQRRGGGVVSLVNNKMTLFCSQ